MRRVLLVDDHPLFRQGIRRVLTEAVPDIHIGECSEGQSAMAELVSGIWDLVVLDITLPGLDGLDVLKKTRDAHPDVPVLILSMHSAAEFGQRTLAAGASGYVTKDRDPAEFVEAVLTALKGRRYFSTDRDEAEVRAPHAHLSDREYQVLRLIAAGKTVSQVAETLALSVKTVSTYRSRILDKLSMTTTAELIYYGVKNGLVS